MSVVSTAFERPANHVPSDHLSASKMGYPLREFQILAPKIDSWVDKEPGFLKRITYVNRIDANDCIIFCRHIAPSVLAFGKTET